MLEAQTKFVTLANGKQIWTRRVGHSPRKLMLVHHSPEMPWNYLKVFTDFAQQNNVEIIFVELAGSYLSDQAEQKMTSLTEQVAEIQHVVAAYHLDHFMIHGIGDVTAMTRQYVENHPTARRLVTTPDDSTRMQATEILGNFADAEYLDLFRSRLRTLVSA